MISTRDLSALPDLRGFRRLTRSLALLDAILSPEWQYRYYSFNSRWAPGEQMASMRNGCGDHWFALLSAAGVALHGLAHESPAYRPGAPLPGIFASLPEEFATCFLNEPAFDTKHSTFCLWRRASDRTWSSGTVELPPGDDPDGSAALLSILDGDPRGYAAFAADYYDREVALDDVRAIYEHRALTDELVRRLNPELELASLAEDVAEIGYPDAG